MTAVAAAVVAVAAAAAVALQRAAVVAEVVKYEEANSSYAGAGEEKCQEVESMLERSATKLCYEAQDVHSELFVFEAISGSEEDFIRSNDPKMGANKRGDNAALRDDKVEEAETSQDDLVAHSAVAYKERARYMSCASDHLIAHSTYHDIFDKIISRDLLYFE
ncbi:hypothetical protein SS1G_09766 [Sclerotinia sclerotiorum 1980 UF-70]|uniref:Fungal N-terminal domain-containing protein n=1 Tax=Sclerotinia sclerotiorum (strain ATCC 18683 / 1980 / Ss-1) TaxID=665079 RepID=A7EWQ7_SCLS1|nr:hypothetical protein SS1G_09766 [Sclerotinia sclerotiorum 1980 UF-70]EDN93899.1 hypothetical protein SS1G_09766 [Sclerotinia sclerotiorum 1980 UF-70]